MPDAGDVSGRAADVQRDVAMAMEEQRELDAWLTEQASYLVESEGDSFWN